jgi:small subunit ribosomal protein S6
VVTRSTRTSRGKKKEIKTAPVVEEQLRDYELMLIINPEVAEENLEAELDDISKLIASMGGAVSDVQQWGKRKLAYPLKDASDGFYVLEQVQLKPTSSKELEAKLQISDKVLRHLMVRTDS